MENWGELGGSSCRGGTVSMGGEVWETGEGEREPGGRFRWLRGSKGRKEGGGGFIYQGLSMGLNKNLE